MKLKHYSKSVMTAVIVTVYLLIYATLFMSGAPVYLLFAMLIPTPVLVIYLVYVVITDKKSDVRELNKDEEFSYQDWPEASEEKDPKM